MPRHAGGRGAVGQRSDGDRSAGALVDVGVDGRGRWGRHPTDGGGSVCCSWSQVAAFSHSISVGRRPACARAKASASNQEMWTTGRSGCSGSSPDRRHSDRRSAVQPCWSSDVVVLLPRPSLVGPPFTPLVTTPLHKRQVRGVGDRRAADQVPADVGAMTGPLVVVGKARGAGADGARAGRDLDQLEPGERARRRGRSGRRRRTQPSPRSCASWIVWSMVSLCCCSWRTISSAMTPSPTPRRSITSNDRSRTSWQVVARLGAAAGTAGRRGRRAGSRTRRRHRPAPRAAAARRRSDARATGPRRRRCGPRSQTSGLISVEWTRSSSSSETGATSASVRSRASCSRSIAVWRVAHRDGCLAEPSIP